MSFAKLVSAALLILVVVGPLRANENVYKKVAPATAYIYKSEGPQAAGTGSGFLIDAKERLLITARHVVETKNGLADTVAIVFAQVKDGEVITEADYYRNNWATLAIRGKVVYDSVRRDMAVIQLEKVPPGVAPLTLAQTKARPAQTIHVIGNSSVVLGGMFNYCQGHVRNTFKYVQTGANVLATQAPTNRGDSGGPVVNDFGEVVGFCSLSTGGQRNNKTDPLDGDQLVDLSICVSEIRAGLAEMRGQAVASNPSNADPSKTRTFKGQAQSSIHFAQMEAGQSYRIVVKAQGFTPDLRVEGPDKKDKNALPNPFANQARGFNDEVQMLFTAQDTAEHRIIINYASGADVKKGPHKYTLTVDRADFETEASVKDPKLQINEHTNKFVAGKIYDIVVRGKGFEPDLRVIDGNKSIANQFNDGLKVGAGKDPGFLEKVGLAQAEYETTLRFVPSKTADFRILVSVGPFSQTTTAKRPYTLNIIERKAELSAKGQLNSTDPLYPKGGPFKVHLVKLEANKNYTIDLLTTDFDSKVLLEDNNGALLQQGFDVGESSARLTFRPLKTAVYRVIATAHQIEAVGSYTLVVAESPSLPPLGGLPPLPEMKK